MSESHSLINVGEFAKPADTLITKISDAIGGLFRPWQIRRLAEAEAAADRLRATTEVEIGEIQRRAMFRFIAEEAKKQNNIENITAKALPEVSVSAKPEQVEDDWITHFFDKCRLISDEEMQTLWARILAGEANSPGKFSKRTIDLLASLDKSDAVTFSKLCSFAFSISGVTPLIYEVTDEIYARNGLDFLAITQLESIGLIRFSELTGFGLQGLPQKGFLEYFGSKVFIEFPLVQNNQLHIGKVLLTKAGQQLAPLSGARPIDGFMVYVKEKWRSLGYKTDPPPSRKPPFGPPQF